MNEQSAENNAPTTDAYRDAAMLRTLARDLTNMAGMLMTVAERLGIPAAPCDCGHPEEDHDDAGACIRMCHWAWPRVTPSTEQGGAS